MTLISQEKTPPRIIVMIAIAWAAHTLVNLGNFALGVMLPDISRDLGFGIEAAGWLSASAWIARAIITIPVSLSIPRFNEKNFLGTIIIIIGVGMILQGVGSSVWLLMLGRSLVMGTATAILTPLVLIKIRWIPISRMGIFNGIETFTGPAGQLIGMLTVPFMMIYFSGWRQVMIAMGVIAFFMSAFWFAISYRVDSQKLLNDKSWVCLKKAMSLKTVQLLTLGWPGTSLVWVAFFTFWPTYAVETLQLTMVQAGTILGIFPVASCVASLTSPMIANKMEKDKPMIWIWGFILPLAYFSMLRTSNITLLSLASLTAGYGAFAFTPIAMTMLYKIPSIDSSTVSIATSLIYTSIAVGGGLGGSLAGILGESMGLYKALAICCLSPLIFGMLTLFLPEYKGT